MVLAFRRPLRRIRFGCLLAVVLAGVAAAEEPAKRPLRHSDYDGWRSIQAPQLSRDGQYLAYLLTPQDGDGEGPRPPPGREPREMDGCARHNPAYRPAKEKPRSGGVSL